MAGSGRFRASSATVALAVLLCTTGLAPIAAATSQDDAGSGSDAGDTFETATRIDPPVSHWYGAELDPSAGDTDDFYKFHLDEGEETFVRIEGPDGVNFSVEILDPEGRPLDVGRQQGTPAFLPYSNTEGASLMSPLTSPLPGTRVHVPEAPQEGDYRLHLESEEDTNFTYEFCFPNCEGPEDGPIWLDPPQYHPHDIRVLLVPPTHGDLGDPDGPTATEYTQTTVQAIRSWEPAIDQFTDEYPEYDYLDEISITLEVWDGEEPSAVGYDVVVGFIESGGPWFRGFAQPGGAEPLLPYDEAGLEGQIRDGARDSYIVLSLFGNSPRAGQVVPDYPELADLYTATLHEFGHALGIGHTTKWTAEHGPDLMNSPAPFVWGNGDPAGDGGQHTDDGCPSSLDLYALTEIYDWIESGEYPSGEYPVGPEPKVDSPLDYELFCEKADPWAPGDVVP